MTQADWVKEMRQLWFNQEADETEALKILEAFISKVELLAQQRTEKKWRDKEEKEKTDKLSAKIERENRELRANPPCYQKGKIGKIV